jgi:two-component system sensor histidine kinase DesK
MTTRTGPGPHSTPGSFWDASNGIRVSGGAHGGDATSVAAVGVTSAAAAKAATPAPDRAEPVVAEPDWIPAGPPRYRRVAWVWAAIWLIYIVQPLQAAWRNPNLTARVISTTAIAIFAVVYLMYFIVMRTLRRRQRRATRLVRWGGLALMIALVIVAAAGVGESALGLFVYVGVCAFFMIPARFAAVLVAALMLASFLVPQVVPGWHTDNGLTFSIFVSSVAVWGVVQIIERNVQLAAAREEIARLAINDERNRFARDLHDILGHTLTVVTVKAELAGRLVRLSPERAEAEIADLERLSRQALHDVRGAVAGYRDVTLATELAGARSALSAAAIQADLPRRVDHVAEDRQELFGWVVREGVTNVVRHSGAKRCRIEVTAHQIDVTDDGRGPTATDTPGTDQGRPAWGAASDRPGHGLVGLRERAEAAGGSLTVGRSAEGGFALRVRMP